MEVVKEDLVKESVAQILLAIGEEPGREGLRDTPARVARMYAEVFSGLGLDPAEAFSAVFEKEQDSGVVVLQDVAFFSMCEHHLLPFFGKAQIGYIPNGKVCGASKLIRALEITARKPQLQERITTQLAEAIYRGLNPKGVAVIIEAEHLCMTMRGVRNLGSKIVTSAARGPFPDPDFGPQALLSMLQRR